MAKHQTRRSISMSRGMYDQLRDYCNALNPPLPMAVFVEEVVRRGLESGLFTAADPVAGAVHQIVADSAPTQHPVEPNAQLREAKERAAEAAALIADRKRRREHQKEVEEQKRLEGACYWCQLSIFSNHETRMIDGKARKLHLNCWKQYARVNKVPLDAQKVPTNGVQGPQVHAQEAAPVREMRDSPEGTQDRQDVPPVRGTDSGN